MIVSDDKERTATILILYQNKGVFKTINFITIITPNENIRRS